jgi:glycosyltransferase involved in cell wall biosynthesis
VDRHAVGIEYPNPSDLMTEIRSRAILQPFESSLPKRSTVIVVTKNHADRLSATLPWIATPPTEVIVVDDSTTGRAAEEVRRLSKKWGVKYHGRREQRSLLGGVSSRFTKGLIAPLGTPGWTLGLCRNYSLLLARTLNVDGVILMDDDIIPPIPDLLPQTLSLLGRFDYVGATTVGLPDDSVVGHIARRHGVTQYDFVTGQYLGVRSRIQPNFFPNEYNEDLVFLLLAATSHNVARCGQVRQLSRGSPRYDEQRAISQERGEVHCEGSISATMSRNPTSLLDLKFWEGVLAFRRRCLVDLLQRERERGGEFSGLLQRVLEFTRTLRPRGYASFYRGYFAAVPRWIELQELMS